MLMDNSHFRNSNKFQILKLHSGVSRTQQQLIFDKELANAGFKRQKIILSTNIAETSITIEDITVVIDTGKVKEKVYDPHTKLSYIKSSFISQASARQRKGRAGRTRVGVCFRLYSALRGKIMEEFTMSELLRMPLEELIIQAKSLNVAPGKGEEEDSVKQFLLKAMDPPHPLSIDHGIKLLQYLHCLDEEERLTSLGSLVAQLPVNPRLGKMLCLGAMTGLTSSMVSLAAIITSKDPFLLAQNDQQRSAIKKIKASIHGGIDNGIGGNGYCHHSDTLILWQLLQNFQVSFERSGMNQARRFCEQNHLSFATMTGIVDLAKDLHNNLLELQLPGGAFKNNLQFEINSNRDALVAALLSGGIYPDIAIRSPSSTVTNNSQNIPRKTKKNTNSSEEKNSTSMLTYFVTEKALKLKIHPGSINSNLGKENNIKPQPWGRNDDAIPADCQIMTFQELSPILSAYRASKNKAEYTMSRTSPMSLLQLLLIAGEVSLAGDLAKQSEDDVETDPDEFEASNSDFVLVKIDNWIEIKMPVEHYQIIQQTRKFLELSLLEFASRCIMNQNLLKQSKKRPTNNIHQTEVNQGVEQVMFALQAEHSALSNHYSS